MLTLPAVHLFFPHEPNIPTPLPPPATTQTATQAAPARDAPGTPTRRTLRGASTPGASPPRPDSPPAQSPDSPTAQQPDIPTAQQPDSPTARPRRAAYAWALPLFAAAFLLLVAGVASAAIYTVNTLGDDPDLNPGDGFCEVTDEALDCTLRAAIQEAAAAPGGPHTIEFDASLDGGTILLGSVLTTITGANLDGLTIEVDGDALPNGITISGDTSVPIGFHIDADAVTIMGPMQITGFTAHGIRLEQDSSNALLDGLEIDGNGDTMNGGGIWLAGEGHALQNLHIHTNLGGQGGGIFVSLAGDDDTNARSFTGLTIEGNEAVEGGGIYIDDGTNTFADATVQGNSAGADGGGLWIGGGTNEFTGTIGGAAMGEGNNADNAGGAAYIDGGTNTFQAGTLIHGNIADDLGLGGGGIYIAAGDNTFAGVAVGGAGAGEGNTAPQGGGVRILGGTNLFDGNTEIAGNVATTLHGAGVFIGAGTSNTFSGVDIHSNTATTGHGGGVYIDSGDLNTFDSGTTIRDNTATSGHGGGVAISGGNANAFNGVNILDNTATSGHGGGVYISGGDNNVFDSGTALQGNEAGLSGGGVHILDGMANTFDTVTIGGPGAGEENTAGASGGGVRLAGGSNTFSATDVLGNAAPDGAGVTITAGTNTFEGGTAIEKNVASTSGGGLWLAGGDNTFSGVDILENDGGSGGGGFIDGGINLFEAGTRIQGNAATAFGGGVYILDGANTFDAVSIGGAGPSQGNTADSGGGVYIGGGINTFVSLTDITGNMATTAGGGVFAAAGSMNTFSGIDIADNTVSTEDGGGVYISGGTNLFDMGTNIEGNGAARDGSGAIIFGGTNAFTDSSLNDNTAGGFGGGAYIDGGTNTFTDSSLDDNTAALGGGGAFIFAGTNTFTDSSLDNNTATNSGGGAFISGGDNTFTDSSLHNNTADDGGGAIIFGGTNTFTSTSLNDNTAEFGGGAYIDGGTNTFSVVEFSGNMAIGTGSGGGLYTTSGTNTFTEPSFLDNEAGGSGGGAYLDGGDNAFEDALFEGNSVGFFGGGVYVEDGANTFTDSTITGNHADMSGGGVYFDDTESPTLALTTSVFGNTAGDDPDTNNRFGDPLAPATPTIDITVLDFNTIEGTFTDGAGASFYQLNAYVAEACAGAPGARGTVHRLASFEVGTDGAGEVGGGFMEAITISEAFSGNVTITATLLTSSGGDPINTGLPSDCEELVGIGDIVVNHLGDDADADPTDGLCAAVGGDAGTCTLRAALGIVALPGSQGTTITFDPALDGMTILIDTLNGNLPPVVQDGITIDASALADGITIDGGRLGLGDLPWDDGDAVDIGLQVEARDVTVRGLNVTGFDHHGVLLADTARGTLLDSLEIHGNGGFGTDGGGLWMAGRGHHILDTEIHGNIAEVDGSGDLDGFFPGGPSGGGIFLSGAGDSPSAPRVFENVEIHDNRARLGAGGFIGGGTNQFLDSLISSNDGNSGGGFRIGDGTNTFTNTVFTMNTAGDDGGGVFIDAGTNTFTGVDIHNNEAGERAGGVRINDGTNAFTDSTINDNVADSSSGGMRISGGTNTFTDSTINDNFADGDAGGIRISGSSTNTFTGTSIDGNTATEDAGGIRISGSSTVNTFTGGTVDGNSAGWQAGGVRISGGTSSFTDTSISGNDAVAAGGGLRISGGTNTFVGVPIADNTAGHGGGGLRINGGTSTFTDATITGNEAAWGGGATINGGTNLFTDSLFSGNSAVGGEESDQVPGSEGGGGGLFVHGGATVLTSSTVTMNTASGDGGGIFWTAGNLALQSPVHGNSAAGEANERLGDPTAHCPAPDAFGYACFPIPFDFTDILGSGTSLSLGDDELSGAVPIGFDFGFYGITYTEAFVSSNGYLSFQDDSTSGCCSGQLLPDPDTPNNLVAGYWEDLNPAAGGTIHYQTLGTAPDRVFIVQFTDVPHFGGGNEATFQMVLLEGSDAIEVHFLDAPSDGGTHVTGIENDDGTIGLVYRFGDFSESMSAVRFEVGGTPPPAVAATPTTTTRTLFSGTLVELDPLADYLVTAYTTPLSLAACNAADPGDRGTLFRLGSVVVTTDVDGNATFAVPLVPASSAAFRVTATVTTLEAGEPVNTGLPSGCLSAPAASSGTGGSPGSGSGTDTSPTPPLQVGVSATFNGAAGQTVQVTSGLPTGINSLSLVLSGACTGCSVEVVFPATPADTPGLPPGYEQLSLLVINLLGPDGQPVPGGVASGNIGFALPEGANAPEVVLLRLADGQWALLETTCSGGACSAVLPGFSTFAIAADTAPPAITNERPTGPVTTMRPTLGADWSDNRGIALASFTLTIDGQAHDATTGALSVGATGFTYTPTSPLAAGAHNVVVTIQDLSGHTSTASWSFITPSEEGQDPITPPDRDATRGVPVWVWIVIALVALAALGVGGLIFYQQGRRGGGGPPGAGR